MDIIWDPAGVTGTVQIQLLQGADPAHLQLGQVVTDGLDNTAGKFTWNIPSTLGTFATYGFNISLDDGSKYQLSFPFHITPASGTVTSSTTSGTSTATVVLGTGPNYNTSTLAVVTTTSTSTSATATATILSSTGNSTIQTTAKPSNSSLSTSSPTSSGPVPSATKNAAAGNMASSAIVIVGGIIYALAL